MTLLAYWPLNESSGSTAHDHSGNENHGTINDGGDSTVPGATGILGGEAYSFDGSNDYVDIGYSGSPYSDWTVSLWVNHNDWSTSERQGSLAVGENRSSKPLNWDRDGSNQFSHYRGEAAGQVMSVNSVSGGWHHVIVTQRRIDSSTVDLKMYWDGEKVDETTGDYEDMDLSKYIYIGWNSSSGTEWKGKVSEVRIYDRPLTKSEIQYLYSVGERGLQTTSKKTS